MFSWVLHLVGLEIWLGWDGLDWRFSWTELGWRFG